MKVIIVDDKIIDPQGNKVLQSGFFIFKEAVRYCTRRGWKWYHEHGKNILTPCMPEEYLFDRELRYQIYNTLVKNSSSPVFRPYIVTKKIMRRLYRRGDTEFFGIWFVYHYSGVYFCVGDTKAALIWEPELSPVKEKRESFTSYDSNNGKPTPESSANHLSTDY